MASSFPTKDCARIEPALSAYADGTISSVAKAEVEAHLKTCARCSEELFLLRAAIRSVGELPKIQAPPGFATRVGVRLRAEAEARKPVPLSRIFRLIFQPAWPKVPVTVALAALAVYVTVNVARMSPHAPSSEDRAVLQKAPPIAGQEAPFTKPIVGGQAKKLAPVRPFAPDVRDEQERLSAPPVIAKRGGVARENDRMAVPAFSASSLNENAPTLAADSGSGQSTGAAVVTPKAETPTETIRLTLSVPRDRYQAAAQRLAQLAQPGFAPQGNRYRIKVTEDRETELQAELARLGPMLPSEETIAMARAPAPAEVEHEAPVSAPPTPVVYTKEALRPVGLAARAPASASGTASSLPKDRSRRQAHNRIYEIELRPE